MHAGTPQTQHILITGMPCFAQIKALREHVKSLSARTERLAGQLAGANERGAELQGRLEAAVARAAAQEQAVRDAEALMRARVSAAEVGLALPCFLLCGRCMRCAVQAAQLPQATQTSSLACPIPPGIRTCRCVRRGGVKEQHPLQAHVHPSPPCVSM